MYTSRHGVRYLGGFERAEYNAYIKGAKDQKDIDHEEWKKDMRYVNVRKQELIDKACEWLRENVRPYYKFSIESFRKAMEDDRT